VGEHAAGPAELCKGNGRPDSSTFVSRITDASAPASSPNGGSFIRRVGVTPRSRAVRVCSSAEIQSSIFVQPPDSRGRRACRVSRRAGWIWPCILQITQGYAEQRESGRARARRTGPGAAPPVHYHKEPSTCRRLRAILKGGRSHELDRVLGRRGGHHCRRVEAGGSLLGRGRFRASPIPKRGRSKSGHGEEGGRLPSTDSRQAPPRGSIAGNVDGSGQRPRDRRGARVSVARVSFGTAGERQEDQIVKAERAGVVAHGTSWRSADERSARPTATACETPDG